MEPSSRWKAEEWAGLCLSQGLWTRGRSYFHPRSSRKALLGSTPESDMGRWALWKNKGERRTLFSSPWSSHHGPDEKWGREIKKAKRLERYFGGKVDWDERGRSRRNQSLLSFCLE